MTVRTIKAIVTGRVQGVYFRASTREQAIRLGVSGYAKNLKDGRVEVVASGGERALNDLLDWLNQGPRFARVDRLDLQDTDAWQGIGFDIR